MQENTYLYCKKIDELYGENHQISRKNVSPYHQVQQEVAL